MKVLTATVSAAVALAVFCTAAPVGAQGKGATINDAVTSAYDSEGIDARTPSQNGSTTLGDAIQGGFYGNAANPRPSGNGTLPSQSPGPKLNNPTDPDNPLPGASWGDIKGNGNGKLGFNASNCDSLGC